MNRRRTLCAVVALSLVLSLFRGLGTAVFAGGGEVWNGSVASSFAGGDGSEGNPYQIANGAQLAFLAQRVNAADTDYNSKSYILTSDIVLNNTANWKNWGTAPPVNSWTAIGTSSNSFRGVFDGNRRTVSGVYINTTNDHQGLFGYVYYGTVKNIGVVDSYISGGAGVGGVAGFSYFVTVTGSYNTGTVSGTGMAGGVAGYAYSGTVTGSCNAGAVSGTGTTGGIVGYAEYGMVTNSYNAGAVSGNERVGGVVGYASSMSTVKGIYNAGTVSGASSVGGLFGLVSGQITVAGSYYLDTSVTGGNSYGIALTNGQMKDKASFPGFDFANVWAIDDQNGYEYPQFMKYVTGEDSSVWKGELASGFDSGSGSENDPYLIRTAGQLAYLAQSVNAGSSYSGEHIRLESDIVLNDNTKKYWVSSAAQWTPVGTNSSRFRGVFDGNGHEVRGVYTDTGSNYQGLFGYVYDGTVKNIGVVDSYVSGAGYVGGVAGYAEYGTVTNSYNTGAVSGTGEVGGVAGYVGSSSTVTNCYNTGAVSGIGGVGGVAGYVGSSSTVTNCYNTGAVSGTSSVGGVAGGGTSGTVTGSCNTGAISGSSYVGGVTGYVRYGTVAGSCNTGAVSGSSYVGGVAGSSDTVTNSYNTGAVSGNERVGGIVGYASYGTVINSYNTGAVSGNSSVGGVAGYAYSVTGAGSYYLDTSVTGGNSYGIALTNGQMKDKASFPGFDFANVWAIDDQNGYEYPQFMRYLPGGDSSVWKGEIASGFDSGSGSENDPYLIRTAGQLAYLAQSVNAGNRYSSQHIKLESDIVLNDNTKKYWVSSAAQWTPVGTSSNYFRGAFDGNGHKVRGVYTDTGSAYQGLFGYVYDGTVKNIGVVDSYVSGAGTVGGVAGYVRGGMVANSYNTGAVSGASGVGGVAGSVRDGTVINSYNTGAVSGASSAGGVLGSVESGMVAGSYNIGAVSGTGNDVGGVLGSVYSGMVISSYYLDTSVTGGNNLGVALTDMQMKNKARFPGFDFANVWAIDDQNGYEYPQFMKYLPGGDSSVWKGELASGFDSGSGSENDPYLIRTAGQLAYLAQSVNAGSSYSGQHIKLESDIVLNDSAKKYWVSSATRWTPVGTRENSFRGVFDGNGHTVRGVYIDTGSNYQGLFGYVDRYGTVKNIGVVNSYISGNENVGGVAGSGPVTDSYNTGAVSGNENVGGVAGSGPVTDSYNTGTVSGNENVGGVTGEVRSDTVTGNYNTGTVSGNKCVGGVAGNAYFSSTVTDSCNTGAVSGVSGVGGVAGNSDAVTGSCNTGAVSGNSGVGGVAGSGTVTGSCNTGAVSGTGNDVGGVTGGGMVTGSYNTGAVSGNENVGGVAGYGTVTDSYNTGAVSGSSSVGGVAGRVNGMVTNSYNTGAVSGSSYAGGVAGRVNGTVTGSYYLDTSINGPSSYGAALTDGQMRLQGSFVSWDFADTWLIDASTEYPYPQLRAIPHTTPGPDEPAAAYTVTYTAGGAEGADISDTYTPGDSVTVAPCPYTREGYVFAGWKSSYDGLIYPPGAALLVPEAGVCFTAQWVLAGDQVLYTIVFSANRGSDADPYIPDMAEGESFYLPENPYTRSGYYFQGWVSNDGFYQPGDLYTMPAQNISFAAQWDETPPPEVTPPSQSDFSVTYHAGGASGSVPTQANVPYRARITAQSAAGLSRANASFLYWTDQNGVNVYPGEEYTVRGDTHFYAQWGTRGSYAVTYLSGGGTGTAPDAYSAYYGELISVAGSGLFTREGYEFSAWRDQNGKRYAPGDSYRVKQSTAFTALWKSPTETGGGQGNEHEHTTVKITYLANGGTGGLPVQADTLCCESITVGGGLSRDGHRFSGWRDSTFGGVYQAGEAYTIPAGAVQVVFSAEWEPSCTIAYALAGAAGATPAAQTAFKNDTLTLAAGTGLTKENHRFAGWQDGNSGTIYKGGASYRVYQSTEMTAVWEPLCTVTYDIAGGSGITPPARTGYQNDYITLALGGGFSKEGYVLSGWTDSIGGGFWDRGAPYRLRGDAVMTAVWEPEGGYTPGHVLCRVTYLPNNATGQAPVQSDVYCHDTITIKGGGGLVKEGYSFGGWMAGDESGARGIWHEGGALEILSHTTLIARWVFESEENDKDIPPQDGEFRLLYSGGAGAEGIVPQGGIYQHKENVTLAENTFIKSGHHFAGWKETGPAFANVYGAGAAYSMPARDVIMEAQWVTEGAGYTVEYNRGHASASGQEPSEAGHFAGDVFTVAANTFERAGYTFEGWWDDETLYPPGQKYTMPARNVSFVAQWVKNQAATLTGIEITRQPDQTSYQEGGFFNPDGMVVTARYSDGSAAVVTNYTWQPDRGLLPTDSYITVTYQGKTASVSITVQGAGEPPAEYTVSYDLNDGIGFWPPTEIVTCNDIVVLASSEGFSKDGYAFAGWEDDFGSRFPPGHPYTVTQNVIFRAVWEEYVQPPVWDVTYDINGASGYTPDTQYAETNQTIQTAYAGSFYKDGYLFDGWMAQDESGFRGIYFPYEEFEVRTHTTFIAKWVYQNEENEGDIPQQNGTFRLLYSGGFEAEGVAPQGGEYAHNESVMLADNPYLRNGYQFAGWKESGSQAAGIYGAGDSYNMPARDVVMEAQWVAAGSPFTVEYNRGHASATGQAPYTPDYYAGNLFPLEWNTFERSGYVFEGWLDQNTLYYPGQTYTMPNRNVSFVAQWVRAQRTLQYISIAQNPYKTTYIEGEYFDPYGMVVIAHYSDGSQEDVTGLSYWDSYPLSRYDEEVIICYGTRSTSAPIHVTSGSGGPGERVLEHIEITQYPYPLIMWADGIVNLDGIRFTAYYSDGTQEDVTHHVHDFYFDGWQLRIYYEGREFYIPFHVAPIYAGGSCGENVQWEAYSNGTMRIWGEGDMYDGNYNYIEPWSWVREYITTVIVEGAVTKIGNGAFQGFWQLRNAYLYSVTDISSYAFQDCYSLEQVRLPSITNIGAYVFSHLSNFASLYFYNNAPHFGENALPDTGIRVYYPEQAEGWDPVITEYGNIDWASWPAEIGIHDMQITEDPYKTSYFAGEVFDPTGMKLTAHMYHHEFWHNEITWTAQNYSFTPSGALSESDTEVVIRYGNHAVVIPITVQANTAPNLNIRVSDVSGGGKQLYIDPQNVEAGAEIIVALYKNRKFIGIRRLQYEGSVLTSVLYGDMDQIKVMAWEHMQHLRPLSLMETVDI